MGKTEPIKMTAGEIAKLYPDGIEGAVSCGAQCPVGDRNGNAYYCTRTAEHLGNHVGYGMPNKPLAMWRDKTLLWERSAK